MAERLAILGLMESTRVELVDAKPEVAFVGFTSEAHKKWVDVRLQAIGLPMDNVSSVRYAPNGTGREQWLGHWNHQEGELALYKLWNELPREAQLGTMVHELAHSTSPLKEGNQEIYGRDQEMERARAHAKAIATQTDRTRVYLNPYHKALHEAYKAGEIDFGRFTEETHAIMTELRFTNLKHLQQVESAQAKRMEAKGLSSTKIVDGVDKTLITLIGLDHPEVTDVESLDMHITKIRGMFKSSHK